MTIFSDIECNIVFRLFRELEKKMSNFLSDGQWRRVYGFLIAETKIHCRKEARVRRFVEAVFWMARSGAQWRLLPREYGHWNSVYKRFARWSELGVWQRMLEHFAADPDMESLVIDSTIVRAHACAAGAKGG